MRKVYLLLAASVMLAACNSGGRAGFSVAPSNKSSLSAQVEAIINDNKREEEKQEATKSDQATSDTVLKPVEEPLVKKHEDILSQSQTEDKNSLEISEKMFITQINDIYFNFDDYKDKTITVEGMYTLFYSPDGKESAPVVYRKGPGCCGNDGWGGFLLKYEGEIPNDNDWIRVTGTPELVIDGYYKNLYLNVTSLEVKTERGAEFVMQ